MRACETWRECLPRNCRSTAFEYTYVAAEGPVGLLEWTYEDPTVRVRDGVDSYVIDNGKIVGQTIHYTLERRSDLPSSTDAT
jgi:hypothetical protein